MIVLKTSLRFSLLYCAYVTTPRPAIPGRSFNIDDHGCMDYECETCAVNNASDKVKYLNHFMEIYKQRTFILKSNDLILYRNI